MSDAGVLSETGLFLEGLRCAGCAQRVERSLLAIEGVVEAHVSFSAQRGLVRHDRRTDPAALVAEVAALGYDAVPYDPEALDRPHTREARQALSRLLVAAFLAGNVMVAAAALYLGESGGMEPGLRRALRWLCVALSLPAVAWCALPFWKGAFGGLRRGEITMDVPVVLGLAAALVGNVLGAWLESPRVFADSAAMIVFLILLGRTLERGARARAAGAVDRLLALAPRTARRVGPDGVEEVRAVDLLPGDRVVVAPGETIPVDGTVVLGESEVDTSLVTGESLPAACRVGDRVTSGTRNLEVELQIEALCGANEGTLARMAALLERATAERPAIQRSADRVAAFFAPAVLAAAALSGLGGWLAGRAPLDALLAMTAVLIVACPCALGLAAPAAVAASIGRAARLGVLVKSGDALERCARIDRAIFDKTGTVTEGVLSVDDVVVAPGVDAARPLALAAAAEGSSVHPVAAAIRRAAEARALPVADAIERRALPGRGVAALVGSAPVWVGTRAWLEERGATLPGPLRADAEALARRGRTLAWVAESGTAIGVLALSDPPRSDARAAIEGLRELGVGVELVSGDHVEAARLAAERAGIEEVAAEVAPEGKVEIVRKARARGERVVFVGDGINDAAALAAADVGIAMAGGAGVALHAADLVVRSPRLAAVAESVALSRATLRRIRENFGLALAYNAVAVPLAMLGRVDPLTAAVAMGLSSLAVTANATRLLRWRPS